MGERAAFLRSIIANPAEDTPRLVFADWLQEHGEEERAEFIRVQIRNAQQPGGRSYISLQAKPMAFRTSFSELSACKPWAKWSGQMEQNVNPLVLILGGPNNYANCVGWHRGFPAIIATTERNWHHCYARLEGPIEALCLRHQSGCWGTHIDHATAQWRYRSLVNTRIPEVAGDAPGGRVIAAFPNVRRVFGACSAALLHNFCAGNLPEPQSASLAIA